MTSLPFLWLVVFLVVLLVLRWVYNRYHALRLFKNHGIPGPTPKFLSGNLYDMYAYGIPKDTVEVWLKKYGNVFGYYVGDRPHLIINDLEIIKQVMVKEFHKFCDRPKMLLELRPIKYSVMFQTGQRWKKVRSVVTPTFSSTKMKQMIEVMNQQSDILVQVIKKHADNKDIFNVYEKVQALTVDVIGICALAMNINSQANNSHPFLCAVRDFIHFSNNPALKAATCFPFLRHFFVFVNDHLTSGRMTNMVVENLKQVIRIRQESKQTQFKDLLQLLLDCSEETSEDSSTKKKASLSFKEIVANCHISLLAGYETTSTSLAFTVYLLAKHEEVQEKIYKEVSGDLSNNPHPSYEVINSWQYLDQVFQESLRIYPPITGFITRECLEDCTINDLFIPKGITVEVPVWQIHHNPDLWPEPFKFDPDRFSPPNRKNIHPAAFLPFGIGPRACLGIRFAQIEAKLALAKLVWKYELLCCEDTEHPIKLACDTVITYPANGVRIRVAHRTLI